MRCFETAAELPPRFRIAARPARPRESRVLMVDPRHFRVDYAINPHMRDEAGRLNRVDPEAARRQWEALRDLYRDLGFEVLVLPADAALPDMVFAANQSLAVLDPAGRPRVVLSRMRAAERREEVAHFARFYRDRLGWAAGPAPGDGAFEACGDLLPWPGRRFAVAGHGPRSDRAVLRELAPLLELDLALFRLEDPDFYHLDTALVPLDDETALWAPAAFDGAGRELLRALVPRLIEAPESEARRAFATNAHCPDGRHVILDGRAVETATRLEAAGFRPRPVDTGEFIKSGGSVFCLKLMLPGAVGAEPSEA
ncbi:MAG: arginine deiminase-related protein [Planctomycetota bacterium]